MNEFPLVSVIIPCYNHEKYLEETLDSVLANSYKNKEIVIIDDGSKDCSREKIEAWIDRHKHQVYIRFRSRENRGLANTLNELIEMANGEFLCIVASDDILTKESLQKRVEVLLRYPKKMVVIGDAKVINGDGKVVMESAIEELYLGDKKNYRTDEGLKFSVLNNWSIPGPVMMARKDLYTIIGNYPTNLLAEDLNFYLGVIGRQLLVFVDYPVALYRVHDLNTCRVPANKKRIVGSILLSYVNNIKFFSGKFRFYMLKKILGEIRHYLKLAL